MLQNNNFISLIKYENQKLYKDNKNYVHHYKQYLPTCEYVNKFYKIAFKDKLLEQKKVFSNSLDFKNLECVINKQKCDSYLKIIKKLENNNRFVSEDFVPDLLLQHFISVGYSHISFNAYTNYENLKKGKPIVFFNSDKHYLLLPEDFGYKTIFISNKQNVSKYKKHIFKYF